MGMPEWYFLFAYAILRAIPNKLGGVMALVLSILILFIIPYVHTSNIKSTTFKPFSKFFFLVIYCKFHFIDLNRIKTCRRTFYTYRAILHRFVFYLFYIIYTIFRYIRKLIVSILLEF